MNTSSFNTWQKFAITLALFGTLAAAASFLSSVSGSTQIATTISSAGLDGPGSGLVGHWTFDGKDMPQGQVNDTSGQGNHASMVNMSTSTDYTNGVIGQALDFDGNVSGPDDYVATSYAPDLTDVDFSFSTWVNSEASEGLAGVIIGSENGIGSSGGVGIMIDNNVYGCPINKARFFVSDEDTVNSDEICSTSDVADGSWHHIVATYDADGDLYLYVDGSPEAFTAVTSNSNGTLDLTSNPLHIGGENYPSFPGTIPLDGKIDDVRVYDRVLTEDEVKQLYQLGATTKIATTPEGSSAVGGINYGLVGHWTFDGKDLYQNVTDVSGQGNIGYFTSGFSSTTTVPGPIGQALRFDGIDDAISGGGTASPGTVAFDALGPHAGGGGGFITTGNPIGSPSTSPITWNHTVSGTNTILLVGVAVGDNDVDNRVKITGITYNSAPLTLIANEQNGGTNLASSSLWYLIDPDVGSNQISVAFTNTSDNIYASIRAGSVSLTGVDQVTPYEDVTVVQGNSATPATSALPSVSGNMPVAVFGSGGYFSAWGQTTRWKVNGTDQQAGGNAVMSTAPGDTSVTFTHSLSFSDIWSGVAVDVRAAPAGTAGIDVGSTKSISFWAKPNSTTQSIFDIDGTVNIKISGGTVQANNWTGAVIYVDGVQTTTFPDTGWHHVVIKSNTAVDASDFQMGEVNSTFYGGMLDDVRTYNRALSADDVSQLYQLGATTKIATTPEGSSAVGGINYRLVGHWTFDGKDMPLGQVNDASGQGNHSSAHNMSTTTMRVAGTLGQALNFDGSDDYIPVLPGALIPTTNLTLAGWMRVDAGGEQVLASVGAVGVADYELLLGVDSGGDAYAQADAITIAPTAPITLGRWYHYALTKLGSNVILYLDGTQVGSNSGAPTLDFGACTLDVGRGAVSVSACADVVASNADASIDDVRVYSRALSSDEVKQLYQMGAP